MTMQSIITTLAGAFIFPFLIRLVWGSFVDKFGPIGGWMAAAFIVGLTWSLNHGVGLIHQSGTAWIDMAFAAFIGLWVANIVVDNANLAKSLPTVFCAILGGTIGGFVLSCLPK